MCLLSSVIHSCLFPLLFCSFRWQWFYAEIQTGKWVSHFHPWTFIHIFIWSYRCVAALRVTCGLCLSVAKRRRHWNPKSHSGECGRALHWGPAFSRGLGVWLTPCSMRGPRRKAPSLSHGIKSPETKYAWVCIWHISAFRTRNNKLIGYLAGDILFAWRRKIQHCGPSGDYVIATHSLPQESESFVPSSVTAHLSAYLNLVLQLYYASHTLHYQSTLSHYSFFYYHFKDKFQFKNCIVKSYVSCGEYVG